VGALLEAVVAAAERDERAVYLVGGPVRDLFLRRPLRDVDLIVDGDAAALARAAAPAGAAVVSHDRFGTVRLQSGPAALDLSSARRERYEQPGALPIVEPGGIDEDLRRRDFTINAMALPLTAAARRSGDRLLAPAGARADLEARLLRVFHPRSFHDDPTRALRAARLAGRLRFRLSRSTRSALRDALRDGAFGGVSGDRLRREIEKLFSDAALGLDPAAALRLLADWHVLGALEPGLALPRAALAPLRRLGRAIAAPPWPEEPLRSWVPGLALWLADADATSRRRTLRRLSVRGEAAERIDRFAKRRGAWQRALARCRGRGAVDALLSLIDRESLLALWCGADPSERRRIARWALEDRDRRLPLSGSDLTALGLAGPAIGAALARLRAAYLDGALPDREAALATARELAAHRGVARKRARARRGTPRA
jgi:tRNA nucleotidyltransferase (CCA-adding enzyme)